jgi:hypothetical protein
VEIFVGSSEPFSSSSLHEFLADQLTSDLVRSQDSGTTVMPSSETFARILSVYQHYSLSTPRSHVGKNLWFDISTK